MNLLFIKKTKSSTGKKVLGRVGNNVYVPAMLLSFFLSLWVSYTGGTVNLDGIIYLGVADLLRDGDFSKAASLYPWNFYPLLIAGISKFLSLNLENSAFLLTACFSTLLTYAFISCVRVLGGDRKVLFFAAFVIVSHPMFMETRSEVLRDHGYWAFYLLSVYSFLLFYSSPTWTSALLWSVGMAVATLFRIEGALFLFVLPFVIFVRKGWGIKEKIIRFFQAHFVNIIFLLGIFVVNMLNPGLSLLDKGRLGDPVRLYEKFYAAITGGLDGKIAIIENSLLNRYSDEYALPVLLAIPVIMLADKLLGTLTPIYAILLSWHPLRKVRTFKMEFLPVLVWFVSLNVTMLFVVLFVEFFLQKRFVFPLVLILFLFVPFILSFYYEKWLSIEKKTLRSCWLYYFVTLVITVNCLDGIITLPSQSSQYIKEAGRWLHNNTSAHSTLYSNNPKVYFYSDHLADYGGFRPPRKHLTQKLLEQGKWKKYEYVAIWSSRKSLLTDKEINRIIGSQPVEIFSNARNDRVLIYEQKP